MTDWGFCCLHSDGAEALWPIDTWVYVLFSACRFSFPACTMWFLCIVPSSLALCRCNRSRHLCREQCHQLLTKGILPHRFDPLEIDFLFLPSLCPRTVCSLFSHMLKISWKSHSLSPLPPFFPLLRWSLASSTRAMRRLWESRSGTAWR